MERWSSDEATASLQKSIKWNIFVLLRTQVVCEKYSSDIKPPDKETTCLWNLHCLSYLISSQPSIKKTSVKGKHFVNKNDCSVQRLKTHNQSFIEFRRKFLPYTNIANLLNPIKFLTTTPMCLVVCNFTNYEKFQTYNRIWKKFVTELDTL